MYNMTQPLTENQIRTKTPSVFAAAPHSRVSSRYQFVSTVAVLEGLEREGWYPVRAFESRVRLPDRLGFTKHLLRFRRFDDRLPQVGDSIPEIVFVNSHDATSSCQLHVGLYRLVCSNGMVVANGEMDHIKARHTGDVVGEVIEGVYEIVKELPQIAGKVEGFRQIELSPQEQEAFAESALQVRWDEGLAPITPTALLTPRRSEDRGNDLWSTFQRVQENMLKGGVRGRTRNGKRTSTRAVQSVDGNVKLNKALWSLTARMAELREEKAA
jgi:hypothetical protein